MNTDQEIAEFLRTQERLDVLRFITCGSVDDGKSTLIGRLLWEAQQVFEDQIAALKADSRRHGTVGESIDFALLVDGLAAEREQGITIDVAYRYFATGRRKFIVADTPGHEQYTRNMATGASNAQVAILLVDARLGILAQTRRHAYITSLMGVRHVVLAVNKMDLIGFDQTRFYEIAESFREFAEALSFDSISVLPVSALNGENIVSRSKNLGWYDGPTLIGYLETIDVRRTESSSFVFPVQWVNRPDSEFRGFAGTVAEGRICVGDHIRVTRSGQTANVSEIVTFDGCLESASKGEAITLRLDREIDVSRGDVISLSDKPIETTNQFEATLVWMADEAGLVGRSYEIKLLTQSAKASLTKIKYRIDVNTMVNEAVNSLALNDIAVCTLALNKPLAFDAFEQSRSLGAFVLIDRVSMATVAAGMITHDLRRATNIHHQALAVTREDRERLQGHRGRVVWFTGLSGSGKSTLANALEIALHQKGQHTYVLDGDNVRQGINKDLGFTDADRVENIRRIAEISKLMMDAGLIVITAFISPFARERVMARDLIGKDRFVEVHVSTPLEVCEERDVKGLYKKARRGELPNLSGLGSAYEAPSHPDFVIDTSVKTIEEFVEQMLLRFSSSPQEGD